MTQQVRTIAIVLPLIAVIGFVAWNLRESRLRATSAMTQAHCIADGLEPLILYPSLPSCAKDRVFCHVACLAGGARECLGLAYETGKDADKAEETLVHFARACRLGAANGCTNYAATIWAIGTSDADPACLTRTFEKACSAREPFACGMMGRMMLESTTPPLYEEGRRYLERSCKDVGGFSCRVLAKHLESGKLGSYAPQSIGELLIRACATGDEYACGAHASAGETFH